MFFLTNVCKFKRVQVKDMFLLTNVCKFYGLGYDKHMFLLTNVCKFKRGQVRLNICFCLPTFVPGTLLGTFSKNGDGRGVVVGKSANDGILKLFQMTIKSNLTLPNLT